MRKYVLYIFILALIPNAFSLEYIKQEINTYSSNTYFYDMDGDGDKDAVEIFGKIKVYYQENNSFSKTPIILEPPLKNLFFDFCRTEKNSGYDLIYLATEGIYRFKKANSFLTSNPELVVESPSFFIESEDKSIKRGSIAYDFDNDGLDEILLPKMDGVSLFKSNDNSYVEKQFPKISPQYTQSMHGCRYNTLEIHECSAFLTYMYQTGYNLPELLIRDINNDGLNDICYFSQHSADNGHQQNISDSFKMMSTEPGGRESGYYEQKNELHAYFQKPGMQFSDKPDLKLSTPLALKIHQRYMWISDYQRLLDINNDSMPDLMIKHTVDNIMNPKTIYKFFIGNEKEGFGESVDQVFVTKDFSGQAYFDDIDYDGKLDAAILNIDVSFGSTESLARIVLGREVEVQVEVYLGKDKSVFSRTPDYRKKLNMSSKCFYWKRLPNFGVNNDFNGDGKNDLFVRQELDRILVFNYKNRKTLFSKKADHEFEIEEESKVKYDDLNNDQKTDLIEYTPGVGVCVHLSK